MGEEQPGEHFYDRRKEKIVISGKPLIDNAKTKKIFSLLNQIGKKPVLAFGNSMGDSGMLDTPCRRTRILARRFSCCATTRSGSWETRRKRRN